MLVWSPGQRDIIKTVALVMMVLDHANRIRSKAELQALLKNGKKYRPSAQPGLGATKKQPSLLHELEG